MKVRLLKIATAACLLFASPLYADGTDTELLKQIAKNTTDLLTAVNGIPAYIQEMVKLALNIQSPDKSEATGKLQENFAHTGEQITQQTAMQLSAQPTINADMLGSAATTATLPNANDLVYSTLFNQPFFNPDPRNKAGAPPTVNPPYNYVKNVTGMGMPHTMPSASWHGDPAFFTTYSNYYNSIMAIESFGGFVLSNQLAELQNGGAFSTAQTALITQASSSEWLANIGGEEIGKVLRQLLMFVSQSYVLQTQLLQTEKQILTAQIMTNTLLINNNRTTEAFLLSKAQGTKFEG